MKNTEKSKKILYQNSDNFTFSIFSAPKFDSYDF